jgi:hypothetical protein
MKLFSAYVDGQFGPEKITSKSFVIAESKEEAHKKLAAHIKASPRLSRMYIKTVVLTEETAIF